MGVLSSWLTPAAITRAPWRRAAQPWLGLGGTVFAAAAFFPLAFGTGAPQSSLQVLGPMVTFALPAVAMVAFCWNDWPGSNLRAPLSGLANTAVVVVAAVVLTVLGQGVVERVYLPGVFQPGPRHPATFPATLPLAGTAFTAMLQIWFVCEGWPLRRMGRLRSGLAALIISWALAVGVYLLAVNTSAVPAAVRVATGLRNPGGPIDAAEFSGAIIVVGVWQALLFIAWRGWPIATLSQRWLRLLLGNVAVIGLSTLTYLALRDLAHWQPQDIGAWCGCIVAAVLIVAVLFGNWPAARLRPLPGRVVTLALTTAVTVALRYALTGYADTVRWTTASPDQWVATATLSFIGTGIILHVAIWRRWPLESSTGTEGRPLGA